MAGFVHGQTEDNRPFEDLILNLPVRLQRLGLNSRYRAFGSTLTGELSIRDLATPQYYTCPQGGCDNQESRLNIVFEEIARNPRDMGLVLTDLWFSSSDISGSALTALDAPFNTILTDGRGVSVYGIAAPFDGRLHEVPGQAGPVPFEGDHPLFLIAVGTPEQLHALDHELQENSSSPRLREGLRSGRVKRTVFALNPVGDSPRAAPFGNSEAPPILDRLALATLPSGVEVQQYRLQRGEALRLTDPYAGAPTWTGPRPEALQPGAIWQGEYRTELRLWARRGEDCEDGDWLEMALPQELWRPTGGGGFEFRLAPGILAAELEGGSTYLISGAVTRTGLRPGGAATQWMRDWSFEPGAEGRAALEGRQFFKTLYLGEMAHRLETGLASVVAQQRRRVQGFAVLVTVEN
jgi:hypothetical protein